MVFGKWRQRRAEAREVEFCEGCEQVCTADCRAQARLKHLRTQQICYVGYLR
ncbi:MAG TPA: hypothetical protein VFC19_48010 [Candidatus Limnocylindrales bacterium]|nr:hypothetical protein [Candidatus Limnocylindrales bacterium]